jgi:hypothetical protein
MMAATASACARAEPTPDATPLPRLVKTPYYVGAAACLLWDEQIACTGKIAVPTQGGTDDRRAKSLTPIGVPSVAGASITHLGEVACAWTTVGEVWCWGDNRWGAAGQGDVAPIDAAEAEAFVAPARVEHVPPVRAVVAGLRNVCGLTKDGGVWCWGTLLDDTRPLPRPVDGVPPAVEITAVWNHVCLRTGEGAVWCWGEGPDGVGRGPREIIPRAAHRFVATRELPRDVCAVLDTGSTTCWDAIPSLGTVDPRHAIYAVEFPDSGSDSWSQAPTTTQD